MQFSKCDLLYDSYSWATIYPQEILFPSKKFFDRSNGWQVIHLINFANKGLEDEEQVLERGHFIEYLLLCKLPVQNCSEVSVCNWLVQQKLFFSS